jgi:hypothetical protein
LFWGGWSKVKRRRGRMAAEVYDECGDVSSVSAGSWALLFEHAA